VLAALERGGPEAAARALVGAAFHHSDRQAVQGLCLRLVDGEDRALAAVAAICLGHLARVHRQLDTGTVRAALDRQRGDPLVGPRAEDALDDLDTYLRTRPNPNGATDTREPIRLRSKTCRRPFGW
jgi:hypothetical protein